jgi:Lrp/AsnC family leucine-responsive transcriptional regulator
MPGKPAVIVAIPALDETDRKILALLQADARMTNAAIGTEVGLTAPSVFERIRKLEQRGVIRSYSAVIDPNALGKVMTAFLRLTVADDDRYESGVQALRDDPDILECYHVAGEDCFLIKTRVANPAELEALLGRIRGSITVQRSVTMIALSTVKEDTPISIFQ